jgi:dephospho-CoA kinase
MLFPVGSGMTVVALTGGVAAGKTTVTEILSARGALIIDADVLARRVVEPGTPGLEEIRRHFGTAVLDSSGSLDREALGQVVFQDPEARTALNAIIHPRVKQLYDEELAAIQAQSPETVAVYAVPLLAEARSASEFDAIVVVHAPEEIRIRRLQEHRGLSEDEARARIAAQASDDTRLAMADSVLDSSGDLEHTQRGAHELYEELAKLWPDRLSELSRHFPRVDS